MRFVRPILVFSIVVAVLGVAAAWLFAGRQISLLFDRVATVRIASLPATPVAYDGEGFRIGLSVSRQKSTKPSVVIHFELGLVNLHRGELNLLP